MYDLPVVTAKELMYTWSVQYTSCSENLFVTEDERSLQCESVQFVPSNEKVESVAENRS
jgi:hypothetical protein